MLSQAQIQKIWDLSDTIIYREAVEFIQRIVKQEGDPLPATQIHGLLNIAGSANYAQLEAFIIHQRDRDWAPRQRHIGAFYEELQKFFTTLKTQRLRREFHLLDEQASAQEWLRQIDILMIYLAREFIQHLLAENGLLLQAKDEQRFADKSRGFTNTRAQSRNPR